MANHEFFRKFGFFTRPGFLDAEECLRWRELAVQSEGRPAKIYRVGGAHEQDEKQRKTLEVPMEADRRKELDDKIVAVRPELERHFGLDLDGVEPPRCLIYRPGDFFDVHRDSVDEESEGAGHLPRRQLSMVIFLNDPNDPVEPYEGGTLTFHELMNFEGAQTFGFPVDAEAGLLVVFPSSRMHQVCPVIRGRRFTIVAWCLGKERKQACP